MSKLKCVDDLLADFAARTPVRAGSLIITLFGDTISQHGNGIWLGSLITALEPFGLNQRQIRTAVFRLVQEDWLATKQLGRRSYYSFTDSGLRHYEKAARRIYASERPQWDGKWTLVIPAFIANEEKDTLRKELLWLGYGAIVNGVYAHPSGDRQSLDETLQELGVVNNVIVLEAGTRELASKEALKKLAHGSWDLPETEARYDEFLQAFRPVLQAVKKAKQLDPEQCFQIRTLLIHEYRRILLQDADLPDELLPVSWSGKAACDLTANLYRLIHKPTMDYIMQNMEAVSGHLPKAAVSYARRFGRLN